MSQAGSRTRTILFLGAPTASILEASTERLLSYPTPPFEPEPAAKNSSQAKLEEYLGPGSFPTISTFDPKAETTHVSDNDVDDAVDNKPELEKLPVASGRLRPVSIPAWRILPLRKPSMHTGFTQCVYDPTPSKYAWKAQKGGEAEREDSWVSNATTVPDEMEGVEFSQEASTTTSTPGVPLSPNTPHLSFEEDEIGSTEPNSSLMLERSYAVHNLPTSQVTHSSSPLMSSPPDESLLGKSGERVEYETTFYEEDSQPPPLPPIPINRIIDLEDLPTAQELLNPYKTKSCTILVGVMKIESQIIKTKYQNQANPSGEVELRTFTVGDYTKAGLQVKIWLPVGKPAQEPANPSLIPGLAKCKHLVRGDIVLFQELALSVFRGVVYANSLRNERSKAVLVYRESKGFRADLSDPVDAVVEKVRRVREWVRSYVGYGDEDLGNDDSRESL